MYSKIFSQASTFLKKCTQFELFCLASLFLTFVSLIIVFILQIRFYLQFRSFFNSNPAQEYHLLSEPNLSTDDNLDSVLSSSPLSSEVIIFWVDIGGAVKEPGLKKLEVILSEKPRLYQAIDLAGGWHNQVNLDYLNRTLNLAQPLEDGQKIYIPFQSEDLSLISGYQSASPSTSSNNDSKSTQALISLNNSSLKELQQLVGVGEVKAQNIINNRPFNSLEEAVSSKVISQKIVDDNIDLLTL